MRLARVVVGISLSKLNIFMTLCYHSTAGGGLSQPTIIVALLLETALSLELLPNQPRIALSGPLL